MTRRILVICGSRALDASPRPRRWAKREIAAALARFAPDVVVHGFARGPDAWSDELAVWLDIPRVVFSLSRFEPRVRSERGDRPAAEAERYRYDSSDPLSRNAAMIRWAVDRAAEGHAVRVLALTAGWSGTGGTRHTMALARDAGLHVEHHEAPDWTWPERATSGAEGESR